MSTIGFLHTSPVHGPTFDALVGELAPSWTTASVVDESLLAAARDAGPDDAAVSDAIGSALDAIVHAGADVVVCTCSTIAATAERIGRRRGLDVVRVDRPMAERAVVSGRRIAVVATVESTVSPTRTLIETVAVELDRRPEVAVHLVSDAWPLFEAGDLDGYLDTVARALPPIAATCDVVVLAQASMAPAADRVECAVPVLSSPRAAIEWIVARTDFQVVSDTT